EAVAIERSAENLSMLGQALVIVKDGQPSAAELDEARKAATEALKLKPKDDYAHGVLAQIAVEANDLDALKRETDTLEVIAPKAFQTHLLRANVAAAEGDWDGAFAALDRAHRLGFPD